MSEYLRVQIFAIFAFSRMQFYLHSGSQTVYSTDPHWKDLVLFYEYFDGDTGRGCGARYVTFRTSMIDHVTIILYVSRN